MQAHYPCLIKKEAMVIKKTLRILSPQGPRLKKEGGLLLSRIALQYHRRNRA